MILEQFYLDCLSQASYLIGDESSGVAAIVDPRRDVDIYIQEAKQRGLTIRHVLLTHFHADFASGHLELKKRTGASIHLGAAGKTEYDSVPMQDLDVLDLGEVRIQALATPGHTPESTCYLVFQKPGEEPHAVLTGDTLFIGDVGRPDLMASVGVTAKELGQMLYKSLREKLLPLPDATIVYPGHGAGSACGKNLSSDTSSTIGAQRESNYALQPMSEDEFIQMVATDQPAAPKYFSYDAVLNQSQHGTLEEALEKALTPLGPTEFGKAIADGAQVLDARAPDTYATAHLPGSLNVGIDGRFASWAGAVLDLKKPILIIADANREKEVALRLGRIGLDSVIGFLDGGTFALGQNTKHFERLSARELATELEGESPPWVLDIRGPGEVAQSKIAGSQTIPLPELHRRLDEVPRDKNLVVHCAGGYRSAIAASLLMQANYDPVRDLRGGMKAWLAAELPVEGEQAKATCSAT